MFRYLWGSLLLSPPVIHLLEPSLHSSTIAFIENLLCVRHSSRLRGQRKEHYSLGPHLYGACKWGETDNKKDLSKILTIKSKECYTFQEGNQNNAIDSNQRRGQPLR